MPGRQHQAAPCILPRRPALKIQRLATVEGPDGRGTPARLPATHTHSHSKGVWWVRWRVARTQLHKVSQAIISLVTLPPRASLTAACSPPGLLKIGRRFKRVVCCATLCRWSLAAPIALTVPFVCLPSQSSLLLLEALVPRQC